jgi:transglutaminase-like putative cysteine protease
MELRTRYQSRFRYPEPVRDSHNLLRACPADGDGQTLLSYRLEVSPAARILSYRDAWGTKVDTFGVEEPHRELTVLAESVATTSERPSPAFPVPLTDALNRDFTEENWEFIQPTRHTRWSDTLAWSAADLIEGAGTLQEAISRVDTAIREKMIYRPGSTYIGVDVNEVFDRGEGVCQDFVHLFLAMFRSQGLAARYVSGYFYAEDSSVGTVPEAEEIVVQTHAWVEVAVPGFGWWGIDPTNAQPAGERHLKIGHGRDYDDVLPLRGVYVGAVEHKLSAGVVMSRSTLSAVKFSGDVDAMMVADHQAQQRQLQQQQQQQ